MDTRIFVHKKEQFQVKSESLAAELRQSLSLKEDFIRKSAHFSLYPVRR